MRHLTAIALLLSFSAGVQGGPILPMEIISWDREPKDFPQATIVCKAKMGEFPREERGSQRYITPNGVTHRVNCDVISVLKGEPVDKLDIEFRQFSNGIVMPGIDQVVPGETYIIMLNKTSAPYFMFAAMRGVSKVVPPKFGTRPGERLLAEMEALWHSDDKALKIAAVTQAGFLRDVRGNEFISAAALSGDPEMARAGVIAQYRLKIAPDARRVMELFDRQIMEVWYEESGTPRLTEAGQRQSRIRGRQAFAERGLSDFDYATYLREGIKTEIATRDDHSLYLFFGTPWKVQRRECIPELIPLLDHPNQKVRCHAVSCLTHTIENQDGPRWEQYEFQEAELLTKWRTWWTEKGEAYMTQKEYLNVGSVIRFME